MSGAGVSLAVKTITELTIRALVQRQALRDLLGYWDRAGHGQWVAADVERIEEIRKIARE